MVSSTLTTIVSTTTGGGSSSSGSSSIAQQSHQSAASNSNNYQYQRPTHSTGGRNFYFSTANNVIEQQQQQQNKTIIPSATTGATSTAAATPSSPLLIETTTNLSTSGIVSGCSNSKNYHYQQLVSSCNSPTAINIPSPTTTTQSGKSDQIFCDIPLLTTTATTTACAAATTSSSKPYKYNNDSILFSTSPPLSDQISILFPKCRPKNDVNLNPLKDKQQQEKSTLSSSSSTESLVVPIEGAQQQQSSDLIESVTKVQQQQQNKSPPAVSPIKSLSSKSPRISTNPFLSGNHSIDQSYRPKLLYYYSDSLNSKYSSSSLASTKSSQQQIEYNNCYNNEMPRKRSYHSGATGYGGTSNTINNQNPFLINNSNYNGTTTTTIINNSKDAATTINYWETRHNTTPASTVLNSPELNESNHDLRNHHFIPSNKYHHNNYHHYQQQHIKVGRSPVSSHQQTSTMEEQQQQQQHNNSMDLIETPTHSSEDGKELAIVADGEVVVFDDITENWQNLRVTTDHHSPLTFKSSKNSATLTTNLETNYKDLNKKYLDRHFGILSSSDSKHGIIEYEGSPRRIGHNSPEDDHDDDGGIAKGGNEDNNSSTIVESCTIGGGNETNNINENIIELNEGDEYEEEEEDEEEDDDEEEDEDDLSTQLYKNKGFLSNSSLYPARPGFPQRIVSPPRESPPPLQPPPVSILKQSTPTRISIATTTTAAASAISNTDTTSIDVSEIGASSELIENEVETLQPALSTTAAATTTTTTKSSSTFDYLYEFSETRKVLEEFFKCPSNDEKPIENGSDVDSIDIQYEFRDSSDVRDSTLGTTCTNNYIGQRLADSPMIETDEYSKKNVPQQKSTECIIGRPEEEEDIDLDGDEEADEEDEEDDEIDNSDVHENNYMNEIEMTTNSINKNDHNYNRHQLNDCYKLQQKQQQYHQQQQQQQNHHSNDHDIDFFLDSTSRSSGEQCDNQDGINQNRLHPRSFRYSPETTDYDSNCGDLDSLSGEFNGVSNYSSYAKYYAASMPVLEDGLSSGHASDTENNNPPQHLLPQLQPATGISMLMDMKRSPILLDGNNCDSNDTLGTLINNPTSSSSSVANRKLNQQQQFSPNDIYCKLDSSPIKSIIDESGRDSVRSKCGGDILGQSPNSNGNNHNNNSNKVFKNIDPDLDSLYSISIFHRQDMIQLTPPPPAPAPHRKPSLICSVEENNSDLTTSTTNLHSNRPNLQQQQQQQQRTKSIPINITNHERQRNSNHLPPPLPERNSSNLSSTLMNTISAENNSAITNTIGINTNATSESPVWVPRHLDNSMTNKSCNNSNSHQDTTSLLIESHHKNLSADEEDVDTDLETDRLLGHQRLDDQGFYDDNSSSNNKLWDRKPTRSLLSSSLSKFSPKIQQQSAKTNNGNSSLLRQGLNSLLPTTPEILSPPSSSHHNQLLASSTSSSVAGTMATTPIAAAAATTTTAPTTLTTGPAATTPLSSVVATTTKNSANKFLDIGGSMSSSEHNDKSPEKRSIETQNSTCNNLDSPSGGSNKSKKDTNNEKTKAKKSKNKEGGGAVLIEGVLFRARYLGSTQLVCEGQPTKSTRMMQAEEAVSRIKAPDGDAQPSTEVDLFISTEKIMVLNTDLKEIMMDHALRTISYIADIGDLVVLMARRRFVPSDIDDGPKPNRTPKMICHVFESDEAQFIAQSIGQAFQVAYMEFLKANGIEDHSFVKEMDYQEVLNSQEIFGDELEIFAKKELQKEVVVPKSKGEILGVVIVESGWGSMLPTVVIANLMSTGAAARCGQLNIGDQLIAINGMSLVGLPLSTCQTYIKNTKNQTVVKFTVVPCPPVVEVKIKRPNTKYQLGFSVQNGVICSLLRGGIAERGGVRVGHRIIEINNQSVVAVPHEKIVNLLATSVGEILMKTMPTSMFRLLTGQENPIYI